MPSAIHAVVHQMLVLDFVRYSRAASEASHHMLPLCSQPKVLRNAVDVKTMHNGACVEVSYHALSPLAYHNETGT